MPIRGRIRPIAVLHESPLDLARPVDVTMGIWRRRGAAPSTDKFGLPRDP